MTYNVLLGGDGRIADLAAVIAGVDPDAVALLEGTEKGTAALAQRLDMWHVMAGSRHRFPRKLGLCIAWLSRKPVLRWQNHPLPELAKTLLEIELDGVRLLAVHLASRHEDAEHPRHRELRAIGRVVGAGPHLLVGDFNALAATDPVGTPPAGVRPRGDAVPGAPRDVLARLPAAGYVDCYRALHMDEPGYTYPAGAPWLRIDYVFASRELAPRVRAADVVRDEIARRASDHLPVWAELS